MAKIIALSIFLAVAGCASVPIVQPTATPVAQPTMIPVATEQLWLNDNPDLDFGGSQIIRFETAHDGLEFIRQTWPDGYELYEDIKNYPVRVNFTGIAYSVQPRNTYGSIGYTLPAMILSPGKYLVKVYGTAIIEVRGNDTDVGLQAHYTVDGMPGRVIMGISDVIRYPGPYRAMFELNVLELGTYRVTVYMNTIFPSLTANSFMTFERITVELAPE